MQPSLIHAAYARHRYDDLWGSRPGQARRSRAPRAALTLFACMFAAQAAAIAVGPVLPSVAKELDVSVAAVGQLRTALGLSAGLTALALVRLGRRTSLRSLLLVSSAAIGAGSAASALAPTFALLVLAQFVIGAGIGVGIAAASAAAAEWAPAEQRGRLLSWALLGQPAAWIVGMPLVGLLGGGSWRIAWIVFPLTAAAAAAAAVWARPAAPPPPRPHGLRETLADPVVAGWAAGEVLANAGWAGVLVYTGALCEDVYGTSPVLTGAILAVAAAAFAAGTVAFRRFVLTDVRAKLLALSPALSLAVLALATVRPAPAVTTAIFVVAAFVAGGRMLLGNAAGLELAPERRITTMSIRTAANHLGYFVGTATSGALLAAYGWDGFGVAAAALIAAAPLPLLAAGRRMPQAVATAA